MKKHNKKGFTIVELVIVIGVIGILSAILIPTFVNVTKNAEIAALKSNLANAYSAYAADAADRVADETKTALEFFAQADVALVEEGGATSGGYYLFNDGWATNKASLAQGKSATIIGTYGGYDIYKVTVTGA